MSEVKRYDPINSDGTCGTCVEDPGYGAYVEFADYAALEAEVQRLREALRITRDTIDAQLEVIASRAHWNYLNKLPVVRSLKAHRARCDATLATSTGQEVGK